MKSGSGMNEVNLTRKFAQDEEIMSPQKSSRKGNRIGSNQPREEKRAGRWTATSRELLSTSRRLKQELERQEKEELKALF